MTNERIIKVTGKGNLKIKPDMTRITITLEGQNKEYDKTLAQSSRDTEALKDILEKQGIDRTAVKTLMFNIDTKYEGYQAWDKSWKERFVGYEFKHMVKVEFDFDNKRLGKNYMPSLTQKTSIRTSDLVTPSRILKPPRISSSVKP